MAEENYNENTDTLNNSEIKVPSYSCKKNSVDQLLCYYLKEKKNSQAEANREMYTTKKT